MDNYIIANSSKIFESEKIHDIQFLKDNLPAQIVLEYSSKKYNINLDEFEVVDGNKINNKNNHQKPKSVIDFFTKEIGISIKEATEICNNLMTKQPKKVVDKIEDEEKSQELIYPYIDKNLEQNKEILNEKNKRKREKIDVILAVYTTKFELSIIFQNEKFTAWYIQGISKEELIEKFTKEEIEYIYYHAV